ncbi:unnamed protein product, partial [Owenia fusiformis]
YVCATKSDRNVGENSSPRRSQRLQSHQKENDVVPNSITKSALGPNATTTASTSANMEHDFNTSFTDDDLYFAMEEIESNLQIGDTGKNAKVSSKSKLAAGSSNQNSKTNNTTTNKNANSVNDQNNVEIKMKSIPGQRKNEILINSNAMNKNVCENKPITQRIADNEMKISKIEEISAIKVKPGYQEEKKMKHDKLFMNEIQKSSKSEVL